MTVIQVVFGDSLDFHIACVLQFLENPLWLPGSCFGQAGRRHYFKIPNSGNLYSSKQLHRPILPVLKSRLCRSVTPAVKIEPTNMSRSFEIGDILQRIKYDGASPGDIGKSLIRERLKVELIITAVGRLTAPENGLMTLQIVVARLLSKSC